MKTFSELQAALITWLRAAPALSTNLNKAVPFISEDEHNLVTEVEKASKAFGLVVIIGQPEFDAGSDVVAARPASPLATVTGAASASYEISIQIGLRENTIVNRGGSGTRLKCMDASQLITRRLQNFKTEGYGPIQVQRGRFIRHQSLQIIQLDLRTVAIFPPL